MSVENPFYVSFYCFLCFMYGMTMSSKSKKDIRIYKLLLKVPVVR